MYTAYHVVTVYEILEKMLLVELINRWWYSFDVITINLNSIINVFVDEREKWFFLYTSVDFWIIKISESGDLVWEKSFGGSQIDEARAIIKTDDGNYIIAGDTRSSDNDISQNKGAADLWLIKISTHKFLLWS